LKLDYSFYIKITRTKTEIKRCGFCLLARSSSSNC